MKELLPLAGSELFSRDFINGREELRIDITWWSEQLMRMKTDLHEARLRAAKLYSGVQLNSPQGHTKDKTAPNAQLPEPDFTKRPIVPK